MQIVQKTKSIDAQRTQIYQNYVNSTCMNKARSLAVDFKNTYFEII